MDVLTVVEQLCDSYNLNLERYRSVSGGDISQAFQLTTNKGNLFLKLNSDSSAGLMFEAEALGLKTISDTHVIATPEVIGIGQIENQFYILMEAIETDQGSDESMARLGKQLAQLHQITAGQFGFENDNFIGSLKQYNDWKDSWSEFYILKRLLPQLHLAVEKGLMKHEEVPSAELMMKCCDRLCHDVKPSLLHGDLWGGNYLISKDGVPVLIDPAVYFGHHEVDIAMTKLFGGFSNAFYNAYEACFPTTPGYEDRIRLYQLYYLLVHLNLFGLSYYGSVSRLIKQLF
ncbi:MAG: fructosamine kinase family protein [Bacteroidia bacterium]|nr:fructosamine kinase family protein [Bacteroidia bacterium]